MQFELPHAFCPHLSTVNDPVKAEAVAGVFRKFGISIDKELLQSWLQEFSGDLHKKGAAVQVRKSKERAQDSQFKIRLDERIPSGLDVYCVCTLCNSKMVHGGWTNHVVSQKHKDRLLKLTSASSSDSIVATSSSSSSSSHV